MQLNATNLMRAAALSALLAGGSGIAIAKEFTPWSNPVNAEEFSGSNGAPNSPAGDGCPILNPYNNDLYIASTRPGGLGGLDIWIAPWNGEGWDEPYNPGAPVNSAANDFCPTPARGNRLFFVSKRDDPNGDIYVVKHLPKKGFTRLSRLPAPINSTAEEWSPSVFENDAGQEVLYFSSTREGGQDIYESVGFGAPVPVGELNTSDADARPNVRRDGLEIVFDTNRADNTAPPDIWTSSRGSTSEPWSPPVPITQVNSPAGESRASVSWDGTMLVFGSGRPGSDGPTDIYVSTRQKVRGPKTVEFPGN